LTPQTRGAIFLVFDANRPSFTVYLFPRDGNENERIGTTKKKKPIDELSERTKTTQNERESVFFTNRVAYYAPRRKCLDGILLRIIRVSPRGSTTSSPWTP
jgi:hypothetical protein